jgi:hypothetical protein
MAGELVELAEIIDHGGSGPPNHGYPSLSPTGRGYVESKLDASPQRAARGNHEAYALRLLGQDQLGGAPFDDLDLVVTPSQRGAPSSSKVVNDLPLSQDAKYVRV